MVLKPQKKWEAGDELCLHFLWSSFIIPLIKSLLDYSTTKLISKSFLHSAPNKKQIAGNHLGIREPSLYLSQPLSAANKPNLNQQSCMFQSALQLSPHGSNSLACTRERRCFLQKAMPGQGAAYSPRYLKC